jgi:hypothetical protein
VFSFGQGVTECADGLFPFFKQPQACSDYFTHGFVAPTLDLAANETLKVIAKGNAGVLRDLPPSLSRRMKNAVATVGAAIGR